MDLELIGGFLRRDLVQRIRYKTSREQAVIKNTKIAEAGGLCCLLKEAICLFYLNLHGV
jgi:hypothetical protein